jgi:hypothetical protein
MKKSIRKLRFERVSQNRLQRALDAIDSLENLSNKSNYDWNQSQIDKISGVLMSRIKLVMASFGSTSPLERYNKLKEQDRIQYRLLKESDPEVYQLVSDDLKKHGHIPPSESDGDIVSQFKELYIDLIERKTRYSIETNSINERRFIVNPRFNSNRLIAKHNIDRLLWLGKKGRTYEEILSPDSLYRSHPDPAKRNPKANLKWDIDQGRVIEKVSNSLSD